VAEPGATGWTASFAAVAALAAAHLLAARLRFLAGIPRSIWLSMAGGVSVAYVFVHLLPELGEHQEVVSRAAGPPLAFLEHHVYLVALLGLVVFYGLERLVQSSTPNEGSGSPSELFWLHIGSFAAYNALVGYLVVHREDPAWRGLVLYTSAMALHFVVNDFSLREHHKKAYSHTARWLLAAAAFAGWALGIATEISGLALGVLAGFLAGGVIMNVLKEELPAERESRFWAFTLGAVGYTAVLLTA
jgi:hypothetical protein